MDIRAIILHQLKAAVEAFTPVSFPDNVSDEMFLDDFWLDSIAFTSLLSALEADLGFIPIGILTGVSFPQTIGELVKAYEDEASEAVGQ
jgi:acyl carrier protein